MFKFRVAPLLALGVLLCTLGLPGCSSSKPSITVTLAPSSSVTINQAETQDITATVANDTSNAGVTWSLSGVGTLSGQTATSVTYTAPSVVTANTTVTVTATSVTNASATAALSITVDAVLTITTSSLATATKGTPYFGVVSATGSAGPFAWTLSSGSLPAGLNLSSSTTDTIVISGTPTATGTSKFTIGVTAGGVSVSQSLSIIVNPPPPLSVATKSLPSGIVGVAYSQTLRASSGVAPFTWSITAGGLPAGLSLSNGVILGTPTTTGSSAFTVKVVDASTPVPQTASANLSITVNPSPTNNAKLNGNYAFLISGFDPSGRFVAAGSFLADGNGSISNGVMDTNDPASLRTAQGFSGTYAIDSTNLGTMTLNITSGGVGSRSLALALMAGGNAQIIEFDDVTGAGTRGSGVLLKQQTAAFSMAAIAGNYAFGFAGSNAQGARYALAGEFHADGAGNFTNGTLDSDDATAGPASCAPPSCTGTYTLPVANPPSGRGTMTISVAGQGTTNYSFYVVSATQLLVMEVDQIAGQGSPIVGGSMLQQSGTGSFAASSLNGTSVIQTTALDTSGGGSTPVSQVGLVTTNGSGSLTLSSDLNTGGTLTSPASAGTYSVLPAGRVTLTNSGIASTDPVLYLVSQNRGFIVGTDPNVTFGFIEAQSGQPFANASLSGTYAGGSTAPVAPSASSQLDIAVADGIGGLTFTTDASTSSGLIQNQVSSATYSLLSSSRGEVTENASNTAIFYMVSPTEFWSMATDAQAILEIFQQ